VQTDETKGRPLTPDEEEAIRQEALAAQTYAPAPVAAPVEPGMYAPTYTGPGQYAAEAPPLDPIKPVTAPPTGPPAVEPGMYEQTYQRPGQAMPKETVTEPGMYEPNYRQPGHYAPRPASTYYGGQLWPTPYTGMDKPSNLGTITPGKRPDLVEVITDEGSSFRMVPDPDATYITPETDLPDTIDPTTSSWGEVLEAMAGGGNAPEHGLASVGPTAPELNYRYQQGDPGVVSRPRLTGDTTMPVRRSDLADPILDQLAGLFGGGQRRSSQVMPLPPGSRRGRSVPTPPQKQIRSGG
jgi:hypothetical protein